MTYLTERITVSPNLCNGRPTIRGLRISVQTVLEFIFAGDSQSEILEQYPLLEQEDIIACQQFALSILERQYTVQPLEDKAA